MLNNLDDLGAAVSEVVKGILLVGQQEQACVARVVNVTVKQNIENKKNIYIRIADQFSKYYTPIVHILALITFTIWYFYFNSDWEIALMNATAVLIITCPCALALAIPIAQTIAISNFLKKMLLN